MTNFVNLTFWAHVYPHKSGLSYPFIDLAKSAFKPYSESNLNFIELFY